MRLGFLAGSSNDWLFFYNLIKLSLSFMESCFAIGSMNNGIGYIQSLAEGRDRQEDSSESDVPGSTTAG